MIQMTTKILQTIIVRHRDLAIPPILETTKSRITTWWVYRVCTDITQTWGKASFNRCTKRTGKFFRSHTLWILSRIQLSTILLEIKPNSTPRFFNRVLQTFLLQQTASPHLPSNRRWLQKYQISSQFKGNLSKMERTQKMQIYQDQK